MGKDPSVTFVKDHRTFRTSCNYLALYGYLERDVLQLPTPHLRVETRMMMDEAQKSLYEDTHSKGRHDSVHSIVQFVRYD